MVLVRAGITLLELVIAHGARELVLKVILHVMSQFFDVRLLKEK